MISAFDADIGEPVENVYHVSVNKLFINQIQCFVRDLNIL